MWTRAFVTTFILLSALWVENAVAHTRLVQSSPTQGAVLAQAPRVVSIDFTSLVEPEFTRIELMTSKGWQPLKSRAEGKRINALLPELASGQHQLRWSVTSRDGHRVNGRLSFSIR